MYTLLVRYGKSTLHEAGTQGKLALRSTYVQRSHRSAAVVRTFYDHTTVTKWKCFLTPTICYLTEAT